MADASYDALVIGGGPNGMTLACYLANAGMSVAVLERQHELGGGGCSEELPVPGFVSNPCANFMWFYRFPPWEDFKLGERGAKYVFCDIGPAAIFDDGTCLQGYPAFEVVDPMTYEERYSAENVTKTLKEISRFSERDAETMGILLENCRQKWAAAYAEWSCNPPALWGQKNAIERLIGEPDGFDPMYQFMTVKEIAYDTFEFGGLRSYFMRGAMAANGCFPDDVMHIADIIDRFRLMGAYAPLCTAVSGTHTVIHALQKAFTEMGGKFFVHHEVDKVLIENGIAKGVRLIDGTEIEARKLIASDADPQQTLLRFVGEEHLSHQLARRVRNFSHDRGNLFWMHFAVHELPEYKAAEWNPDCLRSSKFYYLPKDSDYFAEHHQMELFTRGIPEKLILSVGVESVIDRSRVPDGKHNILVEQFTAPARYFPEREWLRMKKQIVDEMVRQWQMYYAPNMTWDNVIAGYANTPYDVRLRNINMREGDWVVGAMTASQMDRFRPCPELARYQTPIKNLYMCGGSMHYGGGMHGRNGYNCYKIVAEDFALPKVWEDKGRPY